MVQYSRLCILWFLMIIFAQIILATKYQDDDSQKNFKIVKENETKANSVGGNKKEESKVIEGKTTKFIHDQSPTKNVYCSPFPSRDTEKYPIFLADKEKKLYCQIVDKDMKNMRMLLEADGKFVSVTLGSVLACGGSKNAVSFFQNGKKSSEILMLPNVGLCMWHRFVDEEVRVSQEISKLGILNSQPVRTDLYISSETGVNPFFLFFNPCCEKRTEASLCSTAKLFFASYKCPSFESLKVKGIFVIDVKESRSSTWPTRKSLLNPEDDRYSEATWNPIIKPLIKDLYKLAYNGLLFGGDSNNFAIVRNETGNPSYVIRYFGFDFSCKGYDRRDREYGKPSSCMIKNVKEDLQKILGNLFYIQQIADKVDYESVKNFHADRIYDILAELIAVRLNDEDFE